MVNFIGIGAQRTGTSWVYACLYEHPDICIPVKEIHFFSRPRYENGKEWYEDHFRKCKKESRCGEFSTSYLYSDVAAERISKDYPEARIIVIVRNPITRALSQYGNAIKGGEIPETMSFEEYYKSEASVLEQGRYVEQLERYLERFDRSQILVLVYEDNKKDPRAFIHSIYEFLGVRSDFVPSMLHDTINATRIPKNVVIEKMMHRFSEYLRRYGFDRLVHRIRQLGIPELIRAMNTKPKKDERPVFNQEYLMNYFKNDVTKLSSLLGRDLNSEWGISDTHTQ
ncbi:MAG: sulfotransferase domain-containing protein [Candidatus Pacebacteria bacterium]|nr:sulfotransferase domain-containing protein [Candidatus Paceibacterota bacterium]MCF7856937.1 sulfotransferase domain-containing protein [Candidatus Paceibacterota bacterium]